MDLALVTAVLAVVLARMPLVPLLRRLVPLEFLLVVIGAILCCSGSAGPHPPVGPLGLSREGLGLTAVIALKAHALVLGWAALVGTMDMVTLGHALGHLRVPTKLAHLLLFTVRYLDVLHREYLRLRAAMKVRSFRPRISGHTYRAYGYLVGMLLVRSFDRSERVLAAMKCRGFRGHFYLLEHFAFVGRRDGPFCAASVVVAMILLFMEWK
jgi:cobalt/nickel transport system permease protein